MKDNRGLTLVEIIVAIAIMSIVSLVIVGFMHVSLTSYSSANEDMDLQYESQLVMNQLKDLMIDADTAVKYVEQAEGAVKIITLYDLATNGSSESYLLKQIRWDKDEKKIYYCEGVYDKIADDVSWPISGTDALMAEYVEAFDVTIDKEQVEKEGKVIFDITFKVEEKRYVAKNVITLRNAVRYMESDTTTLEDARKVFMN